MQRTNHVPQMQRRHFELIAQTIREIERAACGGIITSEFIAKQFADALRGSNANFRRESFLEARKPDTQYRNRSR